FFQAEDGIRDFHVTGVQTCALPILLLTAPDGRLLVTVGHRVVPLAHVSGPEAVGLPEDPGFRLDVTVDENGNVVRIGDARRLERSEERRVGEGGRVRWAA